MTNRIVWTDRDGMGQSGWDGEVNGRKLFTIEMSVTRGEGWKLSTRLPFAVRKETLINPFGADVLKELAERILVAFVKKIGATFVEEEK